MNRTQAADKLRVLVIEDDETIGQHLQAGLQSNGYDAIWCPDGGTGLTQAREASPAVVLPDPGLPDLDGVAGAPLMRAEQPARVPRR